MTLHVATHTTTWRALARAVSALSLSALASACNSTAATLPGAPSTQGAASAAAGAGTGISGAGSSAGAGARAGTTAGARATAGSNGAAGASATAAGSTAATSAGAAAQSGQAGSPTAGATASGASAGAGATASYVAGSGGTAGASLAAGSGGSAAGTGGASGSAVAGVGGAAGASGTAGTAAKPAFVATGEPIKASERGWTWVPFPDTKCRDGSPSGISVNLNSQSKRVVVYLEGGGGCFNADTCSPLISPSNIGATTRDPGNAGIFDRTNRENPVADWNYVYFPYCTGDVFLGANDEGQIAGISGVQHFVGRLNLEKFFQRVVPTFPNAEQVLLTGISAGGFGSVWNTEFVQWVWADVPVTVIDDSGPPISNEFLPQCMVDEQGKTWRLDRTTFLDCGSDCTTGGDTQAQNLIHIAEGGHVVGLIETDADAVIRGFFGVGVNNGKNDCKGTLDVLNPQMTAAQFEAGLLDYRARVEKYPTFSTFFIANSTQHTWLRDNSFYGLGARADGTRLVDWFRGVLEGKPGAHLGLK